jgi:hypothetical protein
MFAMFYYVLVCFSMFYYVLVFHADVWTRRNFLLFGHPAKSDPITPDVSGSAGPQLHSL